jgi:hypothetical protein
MLLGKPVGRDHLRGLSVDERAKLQRILEKRGVVMSIGYISLRIGSRNTVTNFRFP